MRFNAKWGNAYSKFEEGGISILLSLYSIQLAATTSVKFVVNITYNFCL